MDTRLQLSFGCNIMTCFDVSRSMHCIVVSCFSWLQVANVSPRAQSGPGKSSSNLALFTDASVCPWFTNRMQLHRPYPTYTNHNNLGHSSTSSPLHIFEHSQIQYHRTRMRHPIGAARDQIFRPFLHSSFHSSVNCNALIGRSTVTNQRRPVRSRL